MYFLQEPEVVPSALDGLHLDSQEPSALATLSLLSHLLMSQEADLLQQDPLVALSFAQVPSATALKARPATSPAVTNTLRFFMLYPSLLHH
jgi:hypothetical protein